MKLTAEKVAGMDIGGFLGEHYACDCGKDHFMDMDNIFIESGAINRVAEVVRSYKSTDPLIIADENTFKVAGEKVAHLLDDAGIKYRTRIFPGKPTLVPDEKTAGSILFAIGEKPICLWRSARASSTTSRNTSAAASTFPKSSLQPRLQWTALYQIPPRRPSAI